ncbi:MAG: caspase family protein, partial [Bradyrhizobium sp.]|nr:caspase family protein [Bradyrhizobium sp.]
MNVRQLDISRRSIALAAALIGTVSLAIGAHAALNLRPPLNAAKPMAGIESTQAVKPAARVALVIGNGHYPDASEPLPDSI